VQVIRRSGLAVVLMLVAGCASTPPAGTPSASTYPQAGSPQSEAPQRPAARPAPNLNLSGFSPTFRDGYVDGCATARNGGMRRDESRYKLEMDYVMGWNDGFSVCRK
jgi:hypothetical protein